MRVEEERLKGYGPLKRCIEEWTEEDVKRGESAICEGRVAVVVLAGGQGSRFDPSKVKGQVEVTLYKKKSLFQLICERVLAASKLAGRRLSIAFMTSPQNHSRTLDYFRENQFFGLNSGQIAFFPQSERELLDENEQPFFSGPDQVARGPDGNGALFQCMVESGLWERWKRDGIETVQVLPIDNILALPFDPVRIGVHLRERVDATVLAAKKRDAHEKLGILVEAEKHIRIVEYTELPEEKKEARDADGEFTYRYLNLGLLIFSLDFMKKVAGKKMPYHVARKRSARFENGEVSYPQKAFAYKYERFIFDSFLFSKRVQALLVNRADCYAPLKNLEGEDSIETAQGALLVRDRQTFHLLTGIEPPRGATFELSAEFYYPTEEFLKRWKGQLLPQEGYIE